MGIASRRAPEIGKLLVRSPDIFRDATDLSLPGNYRGIMMLETAYKIVGNIILVRLKPIKESVER